MSMENSVLTTHHQVFGIVGIKITIGDVSLPLSTVRKKRDEYLDMIVRGIDPREDRIQKKLEQERKESQKRNTFDKVFYEWSKKFQDQRTTGRGSEKIFENI